MSKATLVSGVLMLGVFLVNLYLGLYDTNLSSLNMIHYYLNWLIAVVSLVAAVVLFVLPSRGKWIALAGIAWPVVYVVSLGVDVETKLCLGAASSSCWPSHTAALDYLVFNYATIPNATGFGWKLLPVMPVALVLLLVVFILSIYSVNSLRKGKYMPRQVVQKPQEPPVPPKTETPSSQNPQGNPQSN